MGTVHKRPAPQKTVGEDRPAIDDTTVRTHSGWSGIRRPAPLAILPQDRVRVEVRHAAPRPQGGVRARQELPRGLSRSQGLSSHPRRLLKVMDGRRNHGRPQALIATPFLRRWLRSVLHLSLMAHENWKAPGARLRGQRPLRPLPDSLVNSTVFLALFGGHDVVGHVKLRRKLAA